MNNNQYPLGVLGDRHDGDLALIRLLFKIAVDAQTSPPRAMMNIVRLTEEREASEGKYPYSGNIEMLSPFIGESTIIRVFGEYIEESAKKNAALRSQLLSPTWAGVRNYLHLQYLFTEVLASSAAKVMVIDTPVREVRQPKENGPAEVILADGQHLTLGALLRGVWPATMHSAFTAHSPPKDESERVPHPALQRLRDHMILKGGSLTARIAETPLKPIIEHVLAHTPYVEDLPDDRGEFTPLPYLEVNPKEEGDEYTGGCFDPPDTGQAISSVSVVNKVGIFLIMLCTGRAGAGKAFRQLVRVIDTARVEKGSQYARALAERLYANRWIPGARLAAHLYIRAEGSEDEKFRGRAHLAAFLESRMNLLRQRIERAKQDAADLTQWAEALYRVNSVVEEMFMYSEVSGLSLARELLAELKVMREGITRVVIFNTNTVQSVHMGEDAPRWSTYLQELREKSGAEFRETLEYVYRDTILVPKFWYEQVLALEGNTKEFLPRSLDAVDPYRAISINVLEFWSMLWAQERAGNEKTAE